MTEEVLVVGSLNVDLTAFCSRLPARGESLRGSRLQQGHGGKGANQAVMAANLGASTCMIGKVGNDDNGQSFTRTLEQMGINVSHVSVTSEAATGLAMIWVDDEGANSIVIVPGANSLLTPEDIRAATPTIQGASVLLAQLEVKADATLEALRLAHAAGVFTIFNPAPALPDLDEEFYRLSSLVCPNESELAILTGGMPVDTMQEIEAAARHLQGKGAATVLVTLGERGALILPTNGEVELIGTEKVQAVDTSGAGDCFLGSLAALVARGVGLRDAAPRACRIASISVQRSGTQASYPHATSLAPDLQLPPRTQQRVPETEKL